MNKKKQMNHKNKDVHIYSKYRLVFIFHVFLTIFISQTLKNQKNNKENHKLRLSTRLCEKKGFLKGLIFKKKVFATKKKVFRAKWIAF